MSLDDVKKILDPTVTIPSILAICAIVSPVITTLLSNHHQYKMKKLEINSNQKFSAIEQYLNSVGKYISLDTVTNLKSYGEAKGMIYLYIPKSSWKKVDDMDSLISNSDFDKARKLFPEVCKELAKSMQE